MPECETYQKSNAHSVEASPDEPSRYDSGKRLRLRYAYVIDACCFLFMFVNMGLTSTTFNTFQPYITDLPFMTDTLSSWVVAMRTVIALFATFFAALFYRKLDCRLGVTISCLSTALGNLIYSFSNTFLLFMLGSAFTGIAYGLGATVAVTLIIGRWFTKNKASALAVASAGTGLAAIVIPPIVTLLVENISLRFAFTFEAILSVVIAVIIFIFLRNRPPEQKNENPEEATPELARQSTDIESGDGQADLRTKSPMKQKSPSRPDMPLLDFVLMKFAMFLLGLCSIGSNAYLSVLMKTNGFDTYFIAAMLSVSGICLVVFKLLAGVVFDKAGTKRATTLFFTSFFCGLTVLCFTSSTWPITIALGIILVYAGQPLCSIGISIWALELSDVSNRAKTIEHLQRSFAAGTFISNLFPGMIYDATGFYEISYAIFAVAIAVSGILVMHVYLKNRP